jgi:hypothetical protein
MFTKSPSAPSLAVIGGVLLLSVLASLIVARKEVAAVAPPTNRIKPDRAVPQRPARPFAPTYTNIGLSVFFLATVLTLVKWDAISRGPTGHEAITVLRVVEREVAQAKWQHAKTHGAILRRADSTLEHAWMRLEEKRYQDAITTAQSAEKLIEKLIRRN